MSHFVRTHADAVWNNGGAGMYRTVASDWADLDSKQFRGVNGDQGGCWAPSSAIQITGTGGQGALSVTGPTLIAYGGKLVLTGGALVKLGSGADWPKLASNHVGRKRRITQSCMRAISTPTYHFLNKLDGPIGKQSIACTVQLSDGSLEQPRMLMPLRVHDGATFVSATLWWSVPLPRSAPPVAPPRMRVVRCDSAGFLAPLMSVAGGADASGFTAIASPNNGPEWYKGGATQSFAYVCDQNNAVDTSLYTYWLEVIEEVGTAKPIAAGQCDGSIVVERKADVDRVLTNTDPTGNPGGTFSNGQRVLVLDITVPDGAPSSSFRTGIYVANTGGAWARALDADEDLDFTPNFVTGAGGTLYQLYTVRPHLTRDGSGNAVMQTPICIHRRIPHGNVYQFVAVDHENIVDMRPQ